MRKCTKKIERTVLNFLTEFSLKLLTSFWTLRLLTEFWKLVCCYCYQTQVFSNSWKMDHPNGGLHWQWKKEKTLRLHAFIGENPVYSVISDKHTEAIILNQQVSLNLSQLRSRKSTITVFFRWKGRGFLFCLGVKSRLEIRLLFNLKSWFSQGLVGIFSFFENLGVSMFF